jgi:hypothetical protein
MLNPGAVFGAFGARIASIGLQPPIGRRIADCAAMPAGLLRISHVRVLLLVFHW